MPPINAIAKVRFSSAKPQRVHLVSGAQTGADLLCLESGQEMPMPHEVGVLYVITGTATVIEPEGRTEVPPGQLVAPRGQGTLANVGEQRLVCLAFVTGGQ